MPRQAGVIIVSDPGSDVIEEIATLQCVHCGMHFTIGHAPKKVRGMCLRCNGPICGPKCAGKCVPVEQMLENMEAGRPLDHYPTTVSYCGIGFEPQPEPPPPPPPRLYLPRTADDGR